MARVPQYLHLPPQLLCFDLEDFAVLIGAFMVWLLSDAPLYMLLVVVSVPTYLMHWKAQKPRGYLNHLVWKLGFAKLTGYPSSVSTRFDE